MNKTTIEFVCWVYTSKFRTNSVQKTNLRDVYINSQCNRCFLYEIKHDNHVNIENIKYLKKIKKNL